MKIQRKTESHIKQEKIYLAVAAILKKLKVSHKSPNNHKLISD